MQKNYQIAFTGRRPTQKLILKADSRGSRNIVHDGTGAIELAGLSLSAWYAVKISVQSKLLGQLIGWREIVYSYLHEHAIKTNCRVSHRCLLVAFDLPVVAIQSYHCLLTDDIGGNLLQFVFQ